MNHPVRKVRAGIAGTVVDLPDDRCASPLWMKHPAAAPATAAGISACK